MNAARIVHDSHSFQNALDSGIGRLSAAALDHNQTGLPPGHMRVLGCFAVVYTVTGFCRYVDATGRQLEMGPGDLMLIDPNTPHWYGGVPGTNWVHYWVTFEGPVFELWLAGGRLKQAAPLTNLVPIDFWLNRMRATASLPSGAGQHDVLRQVCGWQQLLAEVLALADMGEARAAEREWMQAAMVAVESGLDNHKTGAQIARKLGMSYESFRKRFRSCVGRSPGQYRTLKRMERAAGRLMDTDEPIKQIALALGFCDEFDFSRRFKHVMGISPSQYRRRSPRGQHAVTPTPG